MTPADPHPGAPRATEERPQTLEERDHLARDLARVTPAPVGGGVAQIPQGIREPECVIVAKSDLARLRAEVARLTAEREDHGPDGRNVTNAQHQAMRERAFAAEARAARLTAASDAYQEDVRALLLALGLGDRARPASPHDVLRGEVLPAIERMKVQDGALLSEAWERSLEHVNTMQRAITIMQEDIDRPLFTTRKEGTHEHAG